ncbi:exodeoxyribonuclease VII small subunit [Alterisphingorhabdus coralli]|uniref:Exodeoxyribonuclease 7 small subunit n=1 Tax=Alterisphingorhabdus coralli TaxID=3071408 RepID=A0AA97F880_9SPHN|nr:exodeoxyribonuclease VII small subunit [Parasphingorhabdus sp. SCSIO 66989]WOE75971.1 exodeoxyribonuclease VII small subunit [Parasphingorhabdus sp. SCSIO 66989]
MTENDLQMDDAAIAALSFEDALGRLEHVVRQLESGEASLDSSITLYTLGEKLRTHCQQRLDDAKSRIEKITVGADGKLGTEPLD